ncbi:MAG: Ribosomal protein L11 methyltransferase [Rhodocyclaceae bacterium]|nr:MAG: 50S ribosomal protein L11 methyltransferase [Rhodocyclaceae bacterium]MBE7423332.1 50S ribosomal protein L11 methyltransferase [Zoogloeaceae bacterium]MBV6406596.1 Ribosomal protein L11 methyltransferase [Rhodocyclaceae bacterium]MCK6383146.1 50S ribosomal protein L11 methyltransferase [Rhodocyclaceae bacterium]CAG0927288.1 Ribosomal protein L11 methyltransferase [Rhodocyclaceae bacterium]
MWLSVTIATDAAHAEALSDALLALGALSVGVEDADAGTERETPQFGEPGSAPGPLWARSRVVALFERSADLPVIVAAAAGEARLPATPPFETAEVAEQDWVRLTQSQFEPIRIDDRLWIVPSWHDAPDPDAINLELDPGLAFGTGSHPTTRLCLEWLRTHVHAGASVLDYGCGSGILAIAAAKLGAGRATGVDIDANALAAAEDNATRNGVVLQLMHSRQPLDTTFDIVVANILTNPLCVLAPLLTERTCLGGQLVLSGILASQVAQVQEAYRPGFDLEFRAEREGWALLAGHRRC